MVGGTIYIRWSSEAQTGRDSLRRQLDAARRYAADHQIDVRDTIIDEATSAYSGSHLTRGRLGEFLKRVENGEIVPPHVVLVESFDRLNRQAPLANRPVAGSRMARLRLGLTTSPTQTRCSPRYSSAVRGSAENLISSPAHRKH